jgi:sRNA-binding protein
MSHIVEKIQNCVEVSAGAEMKEEFVSDVTKDTCDVVVCSGLCIILYMWKIF